ncbi:MAG: hypothetical protein OXG81_06035 [Acidobacteria bacterium]|nr:hypothetical protein [Acidobacteriota bacterium]
MTPLRLPPNCSTAPRRNYVRSLGARTFWSACGPGLLAREQHCAERRSPKENSRRPPAGDLTPRHPTGDYGSKRSA